MNRIKRLTLSFARKTLKTDFAQNLIRDLKSLRTLWNILYLSLYVFLCVWTALYHPEHLSTAITVTGGIVSVVFAGYVLTKTYEKVKNGNGNGNHKPTGGDENDASD
jgi:uncharacterized membrane protein (DUF485 family)